MPVRHPSIARALGPIKRELTQLAATCRPADGLRIVVACSGGADSVALLGLLDLLAPSSRLHLHVGHVDHGLRAQSPAEAELVVALAERFGLQATVTRLALASGPSLPARARSLRRAALQRIAADTKAHVIALGHTATDQAETVLLNLARGAGLEGIAAMAAIEPADARPTMWWRPLLSLAREHTRELAQRLALPFVDDPTNVDETQPRVSVRTRVLPTLAHHHPQVVHAIGAAASICRDAQVALELWVETELEARRLGAADPRVEAPTCYWVHDAPSLPRSIRTNLIRAICRENGVSMEALTHKIVITIDRALCEAGRPRTWDLRPNTRICMARGRLWVEHTYRPTNH